MQFPVELPEDGIAVSEEPLGSVANFIPNLSRTKSQALAAGHLRKKNQLELDLVLWHMKFLETKDEIEDIKR